MRAMTNRTTKHSFWISPCILLAALFVKLSPCDAGVGDPQLRTNHVWYPGELACSDFQRLLATQADLYHHVIGREPISEQDKVIASWLWRNTHFFHGEPGAEDLWGTGFKTGDNSPREYWSGLFAHGFGLCGTTHAQWIAEMERMLGHNRARVVGTTGHNSFEVLLRDKAYGEGQWALLDHDLSTIIFDDAGRRLLSIREVGQDLSRWTGRDYLPQKQNGWLVCGLHPDDGAAYDSFHTAEYLAGYSGPPPVVFLRRGESLRRYPQPGLEDGRTFVFWGRNSNTVNIPGPERSITWVNQPDKMFGSQQGAGYHPGQARYGNAVYRYVPDFASTDYREAVIDEGNDHVTFEFYSPYIIAATPANNEPWSIYEDGCRNGLVINGSAECEVMVSVDQGNHWHTFNLRQALDLTDVVKGHRQYLLSFKSSAERLRGTNLTITTVCQANAATMPRLVDEQTTVQFAASDHGVISAGPTIAQCRSHVVDGALDSPNLTLELESPHGEPIHSVYAAAHVRSSNPPDPEVNYLIDLSLDDGVNWQPMVSDWHITRTGDQPDDFWSQSFCWGDKTIDDTLSKRVRVRFHNTGGKTYGRAELHLVYKVPTRDDTQITFGWTDATGTHESSHTFEVMNAKDWTLSTGQNVTTRWIEMRPIPAR